MARLDAGAITLEQLPENVLNLLEHIKRQYSFRAEQEGKEIVLEGDEQTVFSCDRTWLAEAIGNLVKNALDHTAQGDRILVRWQQSPCLPRSRWKTQAAASIQRICIISSSAFTAYDKIVICNSSDSKVRVLLYSYSPTTKGA